MNLFIPDNVSSLVTAVVVALALTWLGCQVAIPIARRLNCFDRPDGKRKLHTAPVPLLGGLAILVGLSLTLLLTCWWSQSALGLTPACWCGISLTSLMLCGLGLYDDLYHVRPKIKLIWQAFALAPYLLCCPVIDSIQILGFNVPLGSLGWIFTGVFLIAAINALNLIDGVDGLAGSVSLIVFIAAAIHASLIGAYEISFLLLIASGSLSGFLLHNWAPARIYLGDSGSHLLGFWVGAFSLISSTKTVTGLTLVVPVVLLSLPAFDTALAILRRFLISRSIAEPDRLHIHHRLLTRGFSPARVTLIISGLSLLMAGCALTGAYLQQEWLSWGGCGVVLCTTLALKLCGEEELRLLQLWWNGTLEPVVTEEERLLPSFTLPETATATQETASLKTRPASMPAEFSPSLTRSP
ncbi:MAG: MraY family glycosyltransferase [Planctomycetaceae bacterium]